MGADTVDSLTKREKECLRLLLGARTAKQVAIALELSPSTVEGYLKSARAKLGVSDSGDAARILASSEVSGTAPQYLGDGPPLLVPAVGIDPSAETPAEVGRRENRSVARLITLQRLLFPSIERPPNALTSQSRLTLICIQALLVMGTSLAMILAFYVFGWALIRLITSKG